MSLELTLNGQRVVFSSPPGTPLLWALLLLKPNIERVSI
jgi:hypothetical protein